MIRIVILWFLSMFAFIGVSAQNAENVLNRAIATYNSAKGVSADFSVSSSQGESQVERLRCRATSSEYCQPT